MKKAKRPTVKERAAESREQKRDEEKKRWEYYRSIPQKHWIEMSGRQAKILIEQAARYGIPFADRVIDLPKVARALHDFLAANKHRLAADPGTGDPRPGAGGDDMLLYAGDSPALERWRLARAKLSEIDLSEREAESIPVAELNAIVLPAIRGMRETGLRLARKFGNDAADIFNEGLDEFEAALRRAAADPDSAGTATPSDLGPEPAGPAPDPPPAEDQPVRGG